MKNRTMLMILLLAAVIASLTGFFASSHPDALEKVAANLRFEEKALGTFGILKDYKIPDLPYPALSSALSGIVGIIILFFTFRSIAKTRLYGKVIKKFLNIR